MLSIKDYAERKGVSTQAVYKQLKTHEKALEGHIEKISGKRYLDDEAVAYLDSQSENTPAVIVQNGTNELVEELKAENERLRAKVEFLQEQMIQEMMKQNERIQDLTDRVLLLTEKEEPKKKWWHFGK